VSPEFYRRGCRSSNRMIDPQFYSTVLGAMAICAQ
jgi:hypothetical protein